MVPTLGHANMWMRAQPSYTRPAALSYCFRVIFGSFPTICFACCDICEVLIDPSSLNSAGAKAVILYENILGSSGPLVLAMQSCRWYSCTVDMGTSSPSTFIGSSSWKMSGPGSSFFIVTSPNLFLVNLSWVLTPMFKASSTFTRWSAPSPVDVFLSCVGSSADNVLCARRNTNNLCKPSWTRIATA